MKETKRIEKRKTWYTHYNTTYGYDPLLASLMFFTKIHQRSVSQHALTAGLPLVENKLTPSLSPRAAERTGLSAQIIKRSLRKISNIVLPAVLLLKDQQAK